jgi:hypothetical protein
LVARGPNRQADAKDVYELLLDEDVSVRFSEVTLTPGTDMHVVIDASGRSGDACHARTAEEHALSS